MVSMVLRTRCVVKYSSLVGLELLVYMQRNGNLNKTIKINQNAQNNLLVPCCVQLASGQLHSWTVLS